MPRGRRLHAYGWIAAAALAYRLVHLLELRTLPEWSHARGDEAYYVAAADALARGELGAFHMSPLYTSLLAAERALVGTGAAWPWTFRLVQAGLALVGASLLAAVSERRLGERTGPWAFAAALFCGPLLHYETQLAVATLASTAMLAALWLTIRAVDDGEHPGAAGRWFWVGVAVGMAVLARPNAAVLVVPVGWALVTGPLLPRARRIAAGLALIAGIAAPITPVTAHNRAHSGEWILVTDTAGLNFFIGNRRGANGTFEAPFPDPAALTLEGQRRVFLEQAARDLGRPVGPGEASRHFLSRTFEEIVADPGAWVRLWLFKLALVFGAADLGSMRSYGFRDELLVTLGPWLVQLGWVLPWVPLGLAVWWRARRERGTLLGFLIAYALAISAMFVLGVYRQVLIPLFLLAAIDGVRALGASLRARAWLRAAVGLAVVAVTAVLASRPLLHTPRADEAYKHAYALHVGGDPDGAERWYREALQEAPDHRAARRNLAILLSRSGRSDEARPLWLELRAAAFDRRDAAAVAEADYFLGDAGVGAPPPQ